MNENIPITIRLDEKTYKKPPLKSKWKLRRTRSVIACDSCQAIICVVMTAEAVGDKYYQKGGSKRLCACCYDSLIGEYAEGEPCEA